MNISVGAPFDAFIRQQVESGRFATAEDVVREGLRLFELRDREEWLLAAIDEADAEVARGETVAFTPELIAELKREALAEIRAKAPINDAVTT